MFGCSEGGGGWGAKRGAGEEELLHVVKLIVRVQEVAFTSTTSLIHRDRLQEGDVKTL